MIRNIQKNFKVVITCHRFLHNSTNLSTSKNAESIKTPPKNVERSRFGELKRYVQTEVCLWYSLNRQKYVQAEAYLWHLSNRQSINPELLSKEQWQHLYKFEAKHERKRYCKYLLYQIKVKEREKQLSEFERKLKNGNRKKILHRIKVREEKKELSDVESESKSSNQERIRAERDTNQHIVYGLGHNSLLLRVQQQTINKWIDMKMHRAKMYGQKIIVDCSYDEYMNHLAGSVLVMHLRRLYRENRKHRKPLDLHFCSVKSESIFLKNLTKQIPKLLNKGSPTEVHTECFTELFPKERLVMLTPNSNDVLDYNFNDIYVIGAIIDSNPADNITLEKAKRLGIRSARLPLDCLKTDTSRELPMYSLAAVVRECQINSNINEIIKKCIQKFETNEKKNR